MLAPPWPRVPSKPPPPSPGVCRTKDYQGSKMPWHPAGLAAARLAVQEYCAGSWGSSTVVAPSQLLKMPVLPQPDRLSTNNSIPKSKKAWGASWEIPQRQRDLAHASLDHLHGGARLLGVPDHNCPT